MKSRSIFIATYGNEDDIVYTEKRKIQFHIGYMTALVLKKNSTLQEHVIITIATASSQPNMMCIKKLLMQKCNSCVTDRVL